MRKRLLGTTTLATLGILAYGVTGGEANAAEPISIEVGGFFGSVMTARDQSDHAGLREFDVDTSGEIQFKGSTTLDNGLTVGVRIEYEAHNQGGGGSIVDERYLTLDGGFGQLKLGSDDSAAYSMHYQAPVAAWQVGLNSPSYAGLSGGGNGASSYLSTYPGPEVTATRSFTSRHGLAASSLARHISPTLRLLKGRPSTARPMPTQANSPTSGLSVATTKDRSMTSTYPRAWATRTVSRRQLGPWLTIEKPGPLA